MAPRANYLRCHPVGRPNESVPSSDGAVELSTDSKVDQLDLGVVGQQNVLAFDITVDDLASMQVRQSFQNFPENAKERRR